MRRFIALLILLIITVPMFATESIDLYDPEQGDYILRIAIGLLVAQLLNLVTVLEQENISWQLRKQANDLAITCMKILSLLRLRRVGEDA